MQHIVVYREKGRFAGWPANHGAGPGATRYWSVSAAERTKIAAHFTISTKRSPRNFARRSRNGGVNWSLEEPAPLGSWQAPPNSPRVMPPGLTPDQPTELHTPIRFDHPDFAMTIRMENSNFGMSRFFFSYDRGKTWQGPHRLPLFGQKGVMGRTDYIVDGRSVARFFSPRRKQTSEKGRPFRARTEDGGLNWRFLSFIGPEPAGYAIMPSSVRLSPQIYHDHPAQDPPRSWIDAYVSHDDGLTWTFLARPEPDTGERNPPSLLLLPTIGCAWFLAPATSLSEFTPATRTSGQTGRATPSDDAGGRDIGYVRSIVRADGKVVAVYYYHDTDIRYVTWQRRSGPPEVVRAYDRHSQPVSHRSVAPRI